VCVNNRELPHARQCRVVDVGAHVRIVPGLGLVCGVSG
jgi:hypothetical protein